MAEWMEKLEQLAELRDKGLLTDEEFEIKRKEIIGIVEDDISAEEIIEEKRIGTVPPNTDGQPPATDNQSNPGAIPSPTGKPSTRMKALVGILLLAGIGIGVFFAVSGGSSSELENTATSETEETTQEESGEGNSNNSSEDNSANSKQASETAESRESNSRSIIEENIDGINAEAVQAALDIVTLGEFKNRDLQRLLEDSTDGGYFTGRGLEKASALVGVLEHYPRIPSGYDATLCEKRKEGEDKLYLRLVWWPTTLRDAPERTSPPCEDPQGDEVQIDREYTFTYNTNISKFTDIQYERVYRGNWSTEDVTGDHVKTTDGYSTNATFYRYRIGSGYKLDWIDGLYPQGNEGFKNWLFVTAQAYQMVSGSCYVTFVMTHAGEWGNLGVKMASTDTVEIRPNRWGLVDEYGSEIPFERAPNNDQKRLTPESLFTTSWDLNDDCEYLAGLTDIKGNFTFAGETLYWERLNEPMTAYKLS